MRSICAHEVLLKRQAKGTEAAVRDCNQWFPNKRGTAPWLSMKERLSGLGGGLQAHTVQKEEASSWGKVLDLLVWGRRWPSAFQLPWNGRHPGQNVWASDRSEQWGNKGRYCLGLCKAFQWWSKDDWIQLIQEQEHVKAVGPCCGQRGRDDGKREKVQGRVNTWTEAKNPKGHVELGPQKNRYLSVLINS